MRRHTILREGKKTWVFQQGGEKVPGETSKRERLESEGKKAALEKTPQALKRSSMRRASGRREVGFGRDKKND